MFRNQNNLYKKINYSKIYNYTKYLCSENPTNYLPNYILLLDISEEIIVIKRIYNQLLDFSKRNLKSLTNAYYIINQDTPYFNFSFKELEKNQKIIILRSEKIDLDDLKMI